MGPSPTYHPLEGEECELSVEHELPLWAEPTVGYCSRRPRPSPMSGSHFVRARAVGPWVGEQKPLGETLLRGNPSSEMTYLPTYLEMCLKHRGQRGCDTLEPFDKLLVKSTQPDKLSNFTNRGRRRPTSNDLDLFGVHM